MKVGDRIFVPIFEKDGNRFFVAHKNFVGMSETHALEIGLGAALVEGIVLDFRFSGNTMEIDPNNIPHVEATIGNIIHVAVISGPIFDGTEKS